MITIEKVGDAIRFTFVGNDHYLNEGTIEVPINSLSLVTDDSGMATFKKSSSNDVFVSATYQELGMTKAELEEFYKENMVGKVGSEITPEEVEEMIDEAVSGKLDTSAITTEITSASTDSQVPSAKLMYDVIDEIEDVTATALNSLNERLDEKLDASAYTPTDLSEYWTSAQTETAISNAISGKADSSAVTESINAAVSGKVDTTDFATYSGTVETALSGKVDTSAITSSVTSASTDSQVPSAKAVYGVATTDEYPIEGVLSAKHFWDDENMGAYTEIGSLNNIKVPNSSLLSNPYISYVFAENEEFMGDTCALVATVTSGSIASVELLNGSSVSSVTATYDNDYMYFTTSASSFSADGLNIVAVMGNDFKPSNVMELRMHITESAVDCGVISVVGNIPSEPTKDSIKRIYDGLNEFGHVNPIADTITLDNGNGYGGGRDNTLIGYGVLNYNTYNPITNTTTSGNTADVFKYNVIDFKGDNNVLRFNKTIIDKSSYSSITPQFVISSFTDGDTSSYNDELFQPTTCMIVETNPNASGGGGMGDEINISISGPNNIEGGISFQLRNSTLEVNVTYNNKTVNKVLYSFANGNSFLIDLRDYWGDTYGTHTFTVDNWRGSNMLTKISFYNVNDRNKLHLEDAVGMLMDKETITLDELDDKLIDYASIESVNIYEYGNPSAVTVSTSTTSLHGTFYGFSVSGVSSGVTVQWYISDGQVSRPYSMTNGVINNNNDSTFVHCINKELTNYENGVVNVFLKTSDAYISMIYASSQPYQGTVYQSITVTPIKDALSGKVDTSTFATYSGTVETALSGKVDTSAITSSVTSASTDSQVPSAKAVYDSIPTTTSAVTSGSTAVVESGAVYEQLGGLKLVKLTQSQYDALAPNYDNNTLYVIKD